MRDSSMFAVWLLERCFQSPSERTRKAKTSWLFRILSSIASLAACAALCYSQLLALQPRNEIELFCVNPFRFVLAGDH
jgi:hypothetical protein